MNVGPARWLHGHLSSRAGVALASAAVVLAGCAAGPSERTAAPLAPPAPPSLQEWMQRAQAAAQTGQREQARQAWRGAARSYPADKLPWQHLAEDYYAAGDYGNAILAAQEVLHRDGRDALGHSVLALGGLRLSAGSLVALREAGDYRLGSRDEAVALSRTVREALGEATGSTPAPAGTGRLAVPQPAARAGAGVPRAAVRPVAAASAAPPVPVGSGVVAPAAMVAPVAVTPRGAAAKPTANPFKLLN